MSEIPGKFISEPCECTNPNIDEKPRVGEMSPAPLAVRPGVIGAQGRRIKQTQATKLTQHRGHRYLSIYLYYLMIIYPSIYLSIYPSVYLSACLPIISHQYTTHTQTQPPQQHRANTPRATRTRTYISKSWSWSWSLSWSWSWFR